MAETVSDGSGGGGPAGQADPDGPSLVESVIYGPLGLALEARTLMPRLVERGRNQVALAKMVGTFAVQKGSEEITNATKALPERVLDLVRSVGLVPGPASPPESPVPPSGAAASPPTPRVSPEAAAAAADIAVTDLAIPGYDLLSASQVVPRLDSLTTDELALVARYEAGTRGRKTILSKVAQLRAPSPEGS